LIFDFEGRILDGSFEFDVFKDGYEDFKQRVGEAIEEGELKKFSSVLSLPVPIMRIWPDI